MDKSGERVNPLTPESDWASDRSAKKNEDYAEICGYIMGKHVLIMRKLQRIMQKWKRFTNLIIRPVQCIYMLMEN